MFRRFIAPGELLTSTNGTPAFTAPETCAGKPYCPYAADVWALGCSLFLLLAGTVPFKAGNLLSLYEKIQNEQHCLPDSLQARCTASAALGSAPFTLIFIPPTAVCESLVQHASIERTEDVRCNGWMSAY